MFPRDWLFPLSLATSLLQCNSNSRYGSFLRAFKMLTGYLRRLLSDNNTIRIVQALSCLK